MPAHWALIGAGGARPAHLYRNKRDSAGSGRRNHRTFQEIRSFALGARLPGGQGFQQLGREGPPGFFLSGDPGCSAGWGFSTLPYFCNGRRVGATMVGAKAGTQGDYLYEAVLPGWCRTGLPLIRPPTSLSDIKNVKSFAVESVPRLPSLGSGMGWRASSVPPSPPLRGGRCGVRHRLSGRL